MKIGEYAAVVVLYWPDDIVLQNIATYSEHESIGEIYAIDNSEQQNAEFVQELKKNPKITYIDNQGNRGIAHALNVGANLAMEEHYEYLLTMDQDSRLTAEMLSQMLECQMLCKNDSIGIITPYHVDPRFPEIPDTQRCAEVIVAMTSGNLLNLSAYRVVGGFNEDLFIDYVDYDFCLRLQKKRYKVIQASHAILLHRLGNMTEHMFFGKRRYVTNHAVFRRYYNARNRCYVYRKFYADFPKFVRNDQKML